MRDYWRAWFAPDRPDQVGLAVAQMLERVCDKIAGEFGLTPSQITASRFFMGYLLGYPASVDKASRRRGDDIRLHMFRYFYGDDAAEVMAMSQRRLAMEDPQVARGAGFGARDGLRYFHDKRDGEDSKTCTTALRSAFDLGEVNLGAGLLQAA